MVAKNDVTGDSLITKSSTAAYRENWDLIFGKKNSEKVGSFPEKESSGFSEENGVNLSQ